MIQSLERLGQEHQSPGTLFGKSGGYCLLGFVFAYEASLGGAGEGVYNCLCVSERLI